MHDVSDSIWKLPNVKVEKQLEVFDRLLPCHFELPGASSSPRPGTTAQGAARQRPGPHHKMQMFSSLHSRRETAKTGVFLWEFHTVHVDSPYKDLPSMLCPKHLTQKVCRHPPWENVSVVEHNFWNFFAHDKQ